MLIYLVIHESGTVHTSLPITSTLVITRNEKTFEFSNFKLIFASSSASEDMFDEINDIISELKG
jgi:hypothetical protein